MSDIAESGLDGIAVHGKRPEIDISPLGSAITPDEVSDRLSANLYKALSDGSADTTAAAIARAQIYVGTILRRLGVDFNLDNQVVREIVLLNVVYELHIALGHEEAGREYRMKSKDIILAAFGDYPDTDNKAPGNPPVASVAVPQRRRAPGF
jgi:hypothetical protein